MRAALENRCNVRIWHCTGDSDQNHPKEKEIQDGKEEEASSFVWGGLTNSWKKKRSKRQRRKGKIYPTENRVSENSKERDQKYFLSEQCKEKEENNRLGKTRDLVKKTRDTKGTFHAKMGTIKDKNGKDLTEAEEIKRGTRIHRRTIQKMP